VKLDSKAERYIRDADLRLNRVAPTWEKFDAQAAPTRGFTLRLNEYELELLRAVTHAEYPRISQQSIAKRVLLAGLLKLAAEPK
jgi:hypothetical protein